QHELGLKDRPVDFDPAVQSCRHPLKNRMPDSPLNVSEDFPGVGLIPAPIEVLGSQAQLHQEIARKVVRLDFAPLLSPQPDEGSFIIAHNDAGVRAAYEITAEFLGVR